MMEINRTRWWMGSLTDKTDEQVPQWHQGSLHVLPPGRCEWLKMLDNTLENVGVGAL
jgi:hypothetical protein